MNIASLVKELRERTGAGILDCKKALEATNNDIDKAVEWLREHGIAKAAKKNDRIAAEGLTKTKVSGDKGLILEVNSETDFVAETQEFLDLLDKIATAIINSDATTVEEAMKILVDGETIEEIITNATATIGEKITLRRFKVINKKPTEAFTEYSHMGGKITSLVVLEKDDAELGKGVAIHIAAERPGYLKTEDVPQDVLDKEEELIKKETIIETLKKEKEKEVKEEEKNAGKTLYSKEEVADLLEEAGNGVLPDNLMPRIEGIVKGRIAKFLKNSCLLEQEYVLDDKKTVGTVVEEAGNKVVAFKYYKVGEGIEKVEVNFADEVAAQTNL